MKRSFIFLILCALAPLSVYAQEVTPNKSVSSKLLPVHISNDVALHVALDKSSRTKSEQKMSSQLLELRAQYKANGSTFSPKGIRPQSADQVSAAQVDQTERIHTYVYVPKTLPVAAFVKMLQRKGIAISAWNKALNIIQVWATVKQLDELAAMTQVRTLEIVTPPMHNTGPVLSEGVSRMHADVAQTVMAAQANGIHVGVMSDDCGSVENLVAPRIGNELAAAPNDPVVVVDNLGANRTHEGLAMMEIVQDVAPLAKLYFATASTGYVNFFNNINALATVDACRVITDDIIYLGEPVYEDGSVNTLIDALAAANNVVYTSASTNAAGFTWTGTFQPDAALQGIGGGGATNTVCDFAGAGTFTNQVVSGGNITITLHWDDQFGNSKNDYDLFVVNSTNTALVASSTSVQNDGSPGNPFEAVSIGPAGTYKIIIRRTSVSAGDPNGNARIKLSCWQTGMQYVNPPGSTFGHPTAANAIGCGAIGSNRSGANQAGPVGNESNYNQIEPFSSLGPCQLINFGAGLVGGNRPVATTRLKPDVASIDGVTTSVGGFAPFYGTSAAAPHCAGIAALLVGLYPSITSAAAQTAIKNGCIDYGPVGPDNTYGAGRTDAFRTIALYRQSVDPSHYVSNYTTPSAAIPDNTPAGINSTLSLAPPCSGITPSAFYVSVTVDAHQKIGDLIYTLKSPDNTTITLMNRPVSTAGTATSKDPNIIFGDAASNAVQTTNTGGLEEVGFYVPANAISSGGFNAHSLGGTWTLNVSDNTATNTGTLKDWGIYAIEGPPIPPQLSINWTPPFLSMGDHTLRTVNMTTTFAGGCTPSVVLQSIVSNEPDAGTGGGDVPGDIVAATGTNPATFQLRAECSPDFPYGQGRYYTIDYHITDVGGYQHDTTFAIPVLCTPGRVDPAADVSVAGLLLDRAPSPDPMSGVGATISYTIPAGPSVPVLLNVSNNLGKWVYSMDYGTKAPGLHTINWTGLKADGTFLPAGVYVYQLTVGAPYNALKTGVLIYLGGL